MFRKLSVRVSNGLVMAAQALGSPSDPIKVLAGHGWLDNCATWNEIAPLYATWNQQAHPSQRLEMVCFDFAGHGWSGHRAAGAFYHFPDYAADVLDLADGLGWQKFHLLGHSMGGAVASMVAATAPERVLSLSMVEILGPVGSDSHEIVHHLVQHIHRRRALISKSKPIYSSLEQAVDARAKGVFFLSKKAAMHLSQRGVQWADETPDPGVGIQLPENAAEILPRDLTWRTDQRLTLPHPFRVSHDVGIKILERIKCPVLVILGNNGIIKDDVQKRFEAIKMGEMVKLPGGHHLHLEEKDALPVAEHIYKFLLKSHSWQQEQQPSSSPPPAQ